MSASGNSPKCLSVFCSEPFSTNLPTQQSASSLVDLESEEKENVLKNDINEVISPHQSLILDHTRVGQILQQLHFIRKLNNLRFALPLNPNTLHSDDATGIEIQRSIDGTELSSTDAFADLLQSPKPDQFRQKDRKGRRT